jgi:DNA invertase Pin-like site-specific DNA recombinase
MNRPELVRLMDDAAPGVIILIELVDRLSRLMTQAGKCSGNKSPTSLWLLSVWICQPAIWR